MGAMRGKNGDRRVTRRDVLRAASGASALAWSCWVASGCGKDGDGKGPAKTAPSGKGNRKGKPVKTTEAVHRKAQESASRSRAPLPADLQGFVGKKVADGTLVRGGKRPVAHHPTVCRKHLPAKPMAAAEPPKPGEALKLHQRYADGILYSLLRAEPDPNVVLRLSIAAALAWPVSVRFADLALSTLKKMGVSVKDSSVDEPALAKALAAAEAAGSGAGIPPTEPTADRARKAAALLRERLAARQKAKRVDSGR